MLQPVESPKLFQSQVLLTNTLIKAMHQPSCPILAPAPGNNKVIIPISIFFYKKFVTTAYVSTETGGVYLTYTIDFADGGVISDPIPYALFNTVFIESYLQPISLANTVGIENFVNCPVYLYQGAAFTGGNAENLLRVSFVYMILDLSTGLFISE